MLRVGLTGGIACGKSAVAGMMAALGAHVVDADKVGHQLMMPGHPAYEHVVQAFGVSILREDKTIDRAKLAELAFGEPAKGGGRVQELNRIMHPAIVAYQDGRMDELALHEPNAIAVVEAALMFEAGAAGRFDRIVTVTCGIALRVARWAARHGVDLPTARVEVERRMAAQWPDEKKIAASDYRIDNSGSLEETENAVVRLMKQLRELAAQPANRLPDRALTQKQ